MVLCLIGRSERECYMIPNEINLGSIIYKILLVRDLLDDERAKKLTGQISINEAVIKIEKDIDPQLQAMTMIHEILHHIMMVTGHDADVRPELIENFIDAIAGGFLTMLRLNPEFYKFIGELDGKG